MAEKHGAPATLDELAKEHNTTRENVRKMHFYHGLLSGRPTHDFNDGKNNIHCQICGYTRTDSKGEDGHAADMQQDR